MVQKIILIKNRRTPPANINQELQWLGNSLGLFNLRDKDSSCFRVFITLVKRSRINKPISSDEIAAYLNLSRGTVVHHLNKLMESGIVIREKNGYLLREVSLYNLILHLEKEIMLIFKELKNIAKEIDEKLG